MTELDFHEMSKQLTEDCTNGIDDPLESKSVNVCNDQTLNEVVAESKPRPPLCQNGYRTSCMMEKLTQQ